jgi:hypothetical protein
VPTTTATPSITGPDGKPITWVGTTPHSTGNPADPTIITIAAATTNYPIDIDQGLPSFTHPLPPEFVPLLDAAEKAWELFANIKFITVPDAASSSQSADIRVGMAFLHPTVGSAFYRATATTDKFLPDTTVRIEDPAETPVTKLSNGDYQYNGYASGSTIFEDLFHELGYALGLDNNPNDPTSIMYPSLTSNNLVPNAQDIAAIQAIYGAPKPHSVVLTSSEITTLKGVGILPASFA